MNYQELLQKTQPKNQQRLAVAAAEDHTVLEVVVQAQERGLIAGATLCGNQEQIKALAVEFNLDISPFTIIATKNDKEAAYAAVNEVRQGQADMLMKGLLATGDLLRAVLDQENGLRQPGSALLSHVCVLYSPILDRLFFLTDAAMVTYPELAEKVQLIANSVPVARAFGVETPKVAVLAAVETVNQKMPATCDAALLTVMNKRGQIKGCLVDGPLAMDLALSAEAAEHKKIKSEVAGAADILLFHNIEAANSVLKTFTIAGNCYFGGLVMGAKAPIVLSSRGDSAENKLFSIACAALVSEYLGK